MSPQAAATARNANALRPEIVRNEIVNKLDQMEYIQMGGEDNNYASAMSEVPMVNMDNPEEIYYTYDLVAGRLQPVSAGAESPVGSLDLPEKERYSTGSYKEKIQPEKGVGPRTAATPFDMQANLVQKFQLKVFLTREQVFWRGDEQLDGLVGMFGQSAHDELDSDHVVVLDTPWSDATNGQPYEVITNSAYSVIDDGMPGGNSDALPTVYVSPPTYRDIKLSKNITGKLSDNDRKIANHSLMMDLLGDEIDNIKQVWVKIPRENVQGEYVDEEGNVVKRAKDAAFDYALDPYDPDTGENVRNAVVGRPGPGSAFMPWWLGDLLDYQEDVPPSGEMAIDRQNGFFTQRWSEHDPTGTWTKVGTEFGNHLRRPENWTVVRNV